MSDDTNIEAVVVDKSNSEVGKVELPGLFATRVNDWLLFDQVLAQRATRRSGTHATKGRSDVSGGGAKPWKQKGTGRARAGSNRSPIWRGGGTIHGPSPRSYAYRLPRKARRGALISALAQKQRDGELKIIDGIDMEAPKTKELRGALENLGVARSVLLITDVAKPNVQLSGRNLPHVLVLPVAGLNVEDVLKYRNLVIERGALGAIEERLAS